MEPDQSDYTGFLWLVNGSVVEVLGVPWTCYSGRNIDHLVASSKFQTLHQAIALEAVQKPCNVTT